MSTEKSLLLNTEYSTGLESTADILGILSYLELPKQAQRNDLFLPSMYIFHKVDDILLHDTLNLLGLFPQTV